MNQTQPQQNPIIVDDTLEKHEESRHPEEEKYQFPDRGHLENPPASTIAGNNNMVKKFHVPLEPKSIPREQIPILSDDQPPPGIVTPDAPKKRWKREDDKKMFKYIKEY